MNNKQRHLTGDLYDDGPVPMTPGYISADGSMMPAYGDLADIMPGQITQGDLIKLQMMGTGDLTDLSMPWDMSLTGDISKKSVVMRGTKTPTAPPAGVGKRPGLTTTDARSAGVLNARAQLLGAGISARSSQDGLLSSAISAAQLAGLGNRALGKFNPTDRLSFVSAPTGLLHQVDGLREGTGAQAFAVKQLLIQQYFTLPYKAFWTATTPAANSSINLKPSFPLNTNVPIVAIVVRFSAPELTANKSKVIGVQLASGVGGVQDTVYYRAITSYDDSGTCTLIFLPALQVDGEYFPTLLTGRRDSVLANDRDVFINVTGNDGTSDNFSIGVLGGGHNYVNGLLTRLL